jgi:hypothetical protein
MRSETKLIFILSFAFLVAMNLVSAIQPVQTTSLAGNLLIAYPQFQTIGVNHDFNLTVLVYNNSQSFTDGNVSCSGYLYNANGVNVFNGQLKPSSTGYTSYINTRNFTQLGLSSFTVNCNSSTQIGFANGAFDVTADGQPYQNFPVVYLLIVLAIVFLILGRYQGKVFKSDVWETFAGILFMIAGILTLSVGFNYTNSNTLAGLAFGTVLIGIGAIVTYYSNSEVFN